MRLTSDQVRARYDAEIATRRGTPPAGGVPSPSPVSGPKTIPVPEVRPGVPLDLWHVVPHYSGQAFVVRYSGNSGWGPVNVYDVDGWLDGITVREQVARCGLYSWGDEGPCPVCADWRVHLRPDLGRPDLPRDLGRGVPEGVYGAIYPSKEEFVYLQRHGVDGMHLSAFATFSAQRAYRLRSGAPRLS